jgi:hypothetical protein
MYLNTGNYCKGNSRFKTCEFTFIENQCKIPRYLNSYEIITNNSYCLKFDLQSAYHHHDLGTVHFNEKMYLNTGNYCKDDTSGVNSPLAEVSTQ